MAVNRNSKRKLNKHTKLIYGEGDDEQTWLNYLRYLFAKNRSGIKIDNGNGGSPDSVLEKMMKRREFGEYSERYALLDSDREEIEAAKNIARSNGIDLIISDRCLEYELLKILGVSKAILKRSRACSDVAKSEFNKICKHDPNSYSKVFTKEKLVEESKNGNDWVYALINAFK